MYVTYHIMTIVSIKGNLSQKMLDAKIEIIWSIVIDEHWNQRFENFMQVNDHTSTWAKMSGCYF
jgi:hypothetical protein